jgi:RimJ/RimL family protein N-acetyltransferase
MVSLGWRSSTVGMFASLRPTIALPHDADSLGPRTVIIRPAGQSDLERVLPLIVPDPASVLTPATFTSRLGNREYRPEWTWIAEASTPGAAGPPLAAGVWWGDPRDSRPSALDGLFVPEPLSALSQPPGHPLSQPPSPAAGQPPSQPPSPPAGQPPSQPPSPAAGQDPAGSQGQPAGDRSRIATELLTAAHEAYAREGASEPPAYHIFLPGDWRDRPDVIAALAWREQAAHAAGLVASLERLRYEWTPRDGLPDPPARLRMRPEPDDEVFAGLFRLVLEGTLDATSRREAAEIGADVQARADVAFYRDKMLGDRAWWLVAETLGGELAGFGIPSRNADFDVVGYLGVLPEHRGHGYVDEILAAITRLLATQEGAQVIRADTDLANRPMAASFERAGYRNFARRLVLAAD